MCHRVYVYVCVSDEIQCVVMLLQANAGDSRGVACVAGRAQELSHDHKPYNQGTITDIFRNLCACF